jgi:3-hydroxyisobutyrate dehydrogenase
VALADQLGVPHSLLVDALAGGPLAAALAMTKIAKMDRADYRPDFSLQWALKDINLALDAGGTRTTPIADAIAERWQHLAAHGLGQLDVSAAAMASASPTSTLTPTQHQATPWSKGCGDRT